MTATPLIPREFGDLALAVDTRAEVVDDDRRTITSEFDRDRLADPVAAAGDDTDLV
jgi:hypothetical protein